MVTGVVPGQVAAYESLAEEVAGSMAEADAAEA
jgi:hypothetical protein